jgi:flagellar hook assembly protein FlgD
VQLEIFDVSGRHVRTLVDRVLGAGEHRANWDGRDDAGSRVGSGVYFARYRGVSGGGTAKLVLVK